MSETTVDTAQPSWMGPNPVEDLEQRVQRLEDVVAAVCDTEALETRVASRVTEKLRAEAEQAKGPPHLIGSTPVGGFGVDPRPPAAPRATWVPPTGEMSFLGEIWWDARMLFQMIRDPLYRMSWAAKVVPVLALLYVTVWAAIAPTISAWPTIPLIGYLDDLLVVYLGLKVLGRELRRYQAFLTSHGR